MLYRKLVLGAALATAAAALAGCGGGGGGDAAAAPAPAPTLPQGIWQKSDRSVTAFVLPNDKGGELWAIFDSGTLLHAPVLDVSGSGFAGVAAALGTSAQPASAQGVSLAAGGGSLSLGSAQGTSSGLAYGTQYDTPARLSDWAGRWELRQATTAGTIVTTLEFGQDGVLVSGTGTSGCTYAGGRVSLRPEGRAVVDVRLSETCGDGPTKKSTDFVGIGSWGVSEGRILADGRMMVLKSDRLSVLQLNRLASIVTKE
jgi:hypothetical protein